MLPKTHIWIGAIFAFFIYLVWPQIGILNAIVIFLASFLIDIDHYLIVAFRDKNKSLKNAYQWYVTFLKEEVKKHKKQGNRKIKTPMTVFHTIEFLALMFALSFLHSTIFLIFITFVFHSLLDVFEMIYNDRLFLREYSLILYFIRRNKKEWTYF